ncbi:MAG: hypothetical protein IPK00_09085 [Deltaproteobacteria bacterium]|nr:hypothetical protein [Deltaproteobacteria bacterium]
MRVVSLCGSRPLDGPVFLLHGGPLRSGERVEYSDVDWEALDNIRELELELTGKQRSLRIWFSVTDGRPYFSCGLRCEDRALKRWPHYLDEDPRIVVRVAGKLIEGLAERVAYNSPEFIAARAHRKTKFDGGDVRSDAERAIHQAIFKWIPQEEKEQDESSESGRLYRIVPR